MRGSSTARWRLEEPDGTPSLAPAPREVERLIYFGGLRRRHTSTNAARAKWAVLRPLSAQAARPLSAKRDASCDPSALERRYALRHDPQILAALHAWWAIAASSSDDALPQPAYVALQLKLYRALLPAVEAREAEAAARDDFRHDAGIGASSCTRRNFLDGLHELAEVWVPDVDASAHADWLRALLAAVTTDDGRRLRRDDEIEAGGAAPPALARTLAAEHARLAKHAAESGGGGGRGGGVWAMAFEERRRCAPVAAAEARARWRHAAAAVLQHAATRRRAVNDVAARREAAAAAADAAAATATEEAAAAAAALAGARMAAAQTLALRGATVGPTAIRATMLELAAGRAAERAAAAKQRELPRVAVSLTANDGGGALSVGSGVVCRIRIVARPGSAAPAAPPRPATARAKVVAAPPPPSPRRPASAAPPSPRRPTSAAAAASCVASYRAAAVRPGSATPAPTGGWSHRPGSARLSARPAISATSRPVSAARTVGAASAGGAGSPKTLHRKRSTVCHRCSTLGSRAIEWPSLA